MGIMAAKQRHPDSNVFSLFGGEVFLQKPKRQQGNGEGTR
jgi:hypothetical protein